MDRDRSRDLTDEDLEAGVREAVEEERKGQLVSCDTVDGIRAVMAELRRERV